MVTEAKKKEEDRDILRRIQQNVGDWNAYYSENNDRYRNSVKFIYDDNGQWTTPEIKEYEDFNKPRMTLNMMPRLINQVVGEYIDNSVDPKVRSTDTAQSTDELQKKIDLLTGLLRFISCSSRTNLVYGAALHSSVSGGFGAFRIIVKEDGLKFTQTPRYKSINDPTKCGWDPVARDQDKADGNICYEQFVMTKSEFKSKYPEQEVPESFQDQYSNFDWITKDDVVIIDYYEKVYFKRHIALLSNGDIVDFDEKDKVIKDLNKKAEVLALQQQQAQQAEPVKFLQEKVADDFKIKFYRAIGNAILERSDWDGKKLPILFMPGIMRWIDGKERTYPLIHWMKDAQRMYNYSRSEFVYRIMLSRYEPYLASEANIEGNEDIWKDAHRARAVLPFKSDPNGHVPKRVTAGEPPQSLLAEMNQSLHDMQQISGRFDANFGAAGVHEESGVLNANRQRAGNLGLKIIFENANATVQSGANAMVDLFKSVLDTERVMPIIDKNGDQKNVTINQQGGTIESNNITTGEFEVEILVGSSFEIQKAEAIAQLTKAYAVMPDLAKISQDVFVKNLDIKDATKLADRVRTYLIPQITTAEKSGKSQDQILQQNMQSQQQQQQMQQQQQQLQEMLIKMKAQDDRMKSMAQAFEDKMGGIATLMNAQTNKDDLQLKGMIEPAKLQAEENRTQLEEEKEALKFLSGGKEPSQPPGF